jgi:hypothetical protein
MPKIYRSMKKAEDGKPAVEASGKGLGVRGMPVNGVADVDLDDQDNVILNGKGMSVAPAWRSLPYFLIPERLKDKVPRARGSDQLRCFTTGEGPFADGPVADALELLVDKPIHGVVAPAGLVALDRYQADLAATRDAWSEDET